MIKYLCLSPVSEANRESRNFNQFADLVLTLSTEGAVKRVLGIATADLAHIILRQGKSPVIRRCQFKDIGSSLTKSRSRMKSIQIPLETNCNTIPLAFPFRLNLPDLDLGADFVAIKTRSSE